MNIIKKGLILIATALTMSSAYGAAIQDGQYQLDPDHSNVGFSVGHLGISLVVGRFNTVSGTITQGPNPQVNIEIETASVDTNQKRRDSHLRSPDFFDVNNHPKITFVSTAIEKDAEALPTKITGDLSLHGVTKSVTFDVKSLGAGQGPLGALRAGFVATTSVKRSDFGMNKLLRVAGDEVDITVNIEIMK